MYTASQLTVHLKEMNIDPNGTLLIHSSMKAIGQVDGGADTVLDVLCDYMKDGLLILPTHTWAQINASNPVFHAATGPSCVGLLTNLFMKRAGVVRSLHPTHSVAALGKDAADYVSGEENARTPCWREGCWGKLYDRRASILFLGCGLIRNTFLHGVEEWNDIPNRLNPVAQELFSVAPDGTQYTIPQNRHHTAPTVFDVSAHYGKMEPAFAKEGAIRYGHFGDAKCILGDAVMMADITSRYLQRDPGLFNDNEPLRSLLYDPPHDHRRL